MMIPLWSIGKISAHLKKFYETVDDIRLDKSILVSLYALPVFFLVKLDVIFESSNSTFVCSRFLIKKPLKQCKNTLLPMKYPIKSNQEKYFIVSSVFS